MDGMVERTAEQVDIQRLKAEGEVTRERVRAFVDTGQAVEETNLPRDVVAALVQLLPRRISLGRRGRGDRVMVPLEDLNFLLDKAADEKRDLRELVGLSAEELAAWLDDGEEVN